jgi:hypothetical protein
VIISFVVCKAKLSIQLPAVVAGSRRSQIYFSNGKIACACAGGIFCFTRFSGSSSPASFDIAGVLLVFSYLIVPPFEGSISLGPWPTVCLSAGPSLCSVGWPVAGLFLSFQWDLPLGAAIVYTFGVLLIAIGFAGLFPTKSGGLIRLARTSVPRIDTAPAIFDHETAARHSHPTQSLRGGLCPGAAA